MSVWPALALDIVATSKPAHSLVSLVIGTSSALHVLIEGTASPHTYQLRPSDAKAVAGASVLVRISEGLEPFTARLAKAMSKDARLVTLADAPGLTRHDRRTAATFEHDLDAHDHDHGEAHGDVVDPHLWLDPANAKIMLAYIADQLSAIEPSSAATYKANAEAASRHIDTLDNEVRSQLAPLANKPFVVFHDSLQYLERRYGLSGVGSLTVSPEVMPGAKRLSALREKIKQLGPVCLFAEPQFRPRILTALAEGTRARTGMLDPEGTQLPAGAGFYEALMRKLAADLKSCLSAG
jgi:zinc transport system substrate-binding protein